LRLACCMRRAVVLCEDAGPVAEVSCSHVRGALIRLCNATPRMPMFAISRPRACGRQAYRFWVRPAGRTMLIDMKSLHAPAYRALLAWLRQSRQSQGLTMRDVAAKLGVPHSWIGKVETGERRLDVAEFERLCRVLDADPHAGIDVVRAHDAYLTVAPGSPAMAAESHGQYGAKRRVPGR